VTSSVADTVVGLRDWKVARVPTKLWIGPPVLGVRVPPPAPERETDQVMAWFSRSEMLAMRLLVLPALISQGKKLHKTRGAVLVGVGVGVWPIDLGATEGIMVQDRLFLGPRVAARQRARPRATSARSVGSFCPAPLTAIACEWRAARR
jgi:hypothetical protein